MVTRPLRLLSFLVAPTSVLVGSRPSSLRRKTLARVCSPVLVLSAWLAQLSLTYPHDEVSDARFETCDVPEMIEPATRRLSQGQPAQIRRPRNNSNRRTRGAS